MRDDDIVTVTRHSHLDHDGLSGVGGNEKLEVPSQTLFTALAPSALFTWTAVDITAVRVLFWRMTITADVDLWSFLINAEPSGSGEEMFAAGGFPDPVYAISWPWVYENGDSPQTENLYIGIRNDDTVASDFVLTRLTGEKLA